jgi:transcriptional regulator with PAS, ATPase and Fis domain
LKHVIEQLVLFYDGPILREGWWFPPSETARQLSESSGGMKPPSSILQHIHSASEEGGGTAVANMASLNRKQKYTLAKRLLEESGEDYSWVASQLGIHPTTLYRWRVKNRV